MKSTKQIVAFLLSFVILLAMIPAGAISAFAATQSNLIDIDIYKAQCFIGIADDPNTNAVDLCNSVYDYYVNEELFSTTKTFLDEAYSNKILMMNFNEWKAYSLGFLPSEALNQKLAKKDYYESLILALFYESLSDDSNTIKKIKLNAAADSAAMVDNLSAAAGVTTEAALETYYANAPASTVKSAMQGAVAGTNISSTAMQFLDVAIGGAKTVIDVTERIALYNEMLNLDLYTKQWLNNMYNACTNETDEALKQALYNLKTASVSFADSAKIELQDRNFRVAAWSSKATIDTTLGTVASLNPISASIMAGLKLGKTLCDIFYKTSDVYEQFFMLECIYDVEELSRTVVKNCESDFIKNTTNKTAKTFIYAVDCYFECLINVEVDCMIEFLDILYNGGFLKGSIRWFYGITDDFQQAVNVLESMRKVRKDNYDYMVGCFMCALDYNYPDTYCYYYTEDGTRPITGISFSTNRILPPSYPAGYADMLVGDFTSLEVDYTPINTTQRAFVVTSDNPGVITIKDNILTAVSAGTANVTVKSLDNPNVSYTAKIKVGNKIQGGQSEGITTWFTYTVDRNDNATITGLIDGYNPTNLYIPSKIEGYPVTKIGSWAFEACKSLTSITIPDSVTSIGDRAFNGCNSLTNINVDINNDYYSSQDGILFNKRKTQLLRYPAGKTKTSYTIPNSVTSIGNCAFLGCENLKSITIHDSVTSIGDGAFYDCKSLTSIKIPGAVRSIGSSMFYGCSSLTGITIPDGVTNIAFWAFCNCENLTSITIPDSVTSISDSAFNGCNSLTNINVDSNNDYYSSQDGILFNKRKTQLLRYPAGKTKTSYTIPNSVTSIGDAAFNVCENLTSITIPDSVTSIGYGAFSYCKSLTSITIPDSVTNIEGSTFCGCSSLTGITLPDSVIDIGEYAFEDCKNLKSITIPDSVKIIGYAAFDDCLSLASITIPTSVKSIDDGAFCGCKSLKTVYYRGNKSNKSNMVISSANSGLQQATWYYNSCIGSAKHTYSNNCDTSCNVCNAKRTIKHTYTNACDTSCNVCKATRTITHAYKTTTTKATLTKNGSIVKKCAVCGKVASSTAIRYAKTFKLSTTAYTYNGAVRTPSVTVKDSAGKTLKKNTDYTVTYASGRKNAGTYKVVVKMIGKYSGTKVLAFKINPAKISSYKLSATAYTYDGKAKTPSVTVKNAGGAKLTKNAHYTVAYSSGRKNVGIYKVIVKGKGNYTGTKTLYFKINPPKTAVYKLASGKKSIVVALVKRSSQVNGYQIQYSTSKTFSKATTKTIPNYKTTKYTLKNLSAKKIYYVRVRTYKKVGKTIYYSGWSAYKYVKTK